MLSFRVRIAPHNTLVSLASYHVSVVREKVESKSHDAISLDCTSAVVAMAFAVEAIINFVGTKKVPDWKERAPFRRKLSSLEDVLGFVFDATVEPFRTVMRLKEARDTMAHGQPVEFQVEVATERAIGKHMQPVWSAEARPEFVFDAYSQVKAFQDLLFKLARIRPGAALTSAFGHGEET